MQKKDYILALLTFLVIFLLGVVIVQSDFIKKTNQINNSVPSIGEVISEAVKEAENSSVNQEENSSNKYDNSSIVVQGSDGVDLSGELNFEILKNGVKVAEIKRKNHSEAEILKQIGENTYIGVSNTGRGGYILFGSHFGLYKFDSTTNEINKILDDDEDSLHFSSFQVYDISPDQKYMVGLGNGVEIRDLQNNSLVKSFVCPDSAYGQLGNVYFFDDGKKLVYEAAVGNPDDEEFAMFTIDIESGRQEMVANEAWKVDAAEWALRRQ
jgi:hypothetical protein